MLNGVYLREKLDHVINITYTITESTSRRNGYHSIDVTPEAEEWWVQEVIHHRGKTSRNEDCTPGYYNFEGEFQRRQDGNYNGSYPEYIAHTKSVFERIEEHH